MVGSFGGKGVVARRGGEVYVTTSGPKTCASREGSANLGQILVLTECLLEALNTSFQSYPKIAFELAVQPLLFIYRWAPCWGS